MSDRAIALLESIDRTLKALLARASGASSSGSATSGEVATDRDLDGQYGDEEIRFDPRDWNGESMKHNRMSECPAEFLDLYAEAKEYFGKKADAENKLTNSGKPVGKYERMSAARARGWAARVRAGHPATLASRPSAPAPAAGWATGRTWPPPAGAPSDELPLDPVTDDDIPF